MAIFDDVKSHRGDNNGKLLMIYADSKEAIQESLNKEPAPANCILGTKRIAKGFAEAHCRLALDWIPGHQGIPGSGEANALARTKFTRTTFEIDHDYHMDGPEEPSSGSVFAKERLTAGRRERLRALFPINGYPIHPTFSMRAKIRIRRLRTGTAITPAVLNNF